MTITTRNTNNGNLKKTILKNTETGATAIIGHYAERSDRAAYELVQTYTASDLGDLHLQTTRKLEDLESAVAYATKQIGVK